MTIVGVVELQVQAITEQLEKELTSKLKSAAAKAESVAKIKPQVETKEAEGAFAKFGSFIQGHLSSFAGKSNVASQALGELEKAGIGAGAAIGASFGGVALAAVAKFAEVGIKNFLDLTGEIRRFKTVTGSTAETASSFVVALHDLGVEPDAVAKGFFKLSKEIAAGKGTLADFGIETARNKDGNIDLTKTFLNIADAVHKESDATVRNEIVFKAFGRAGLGLLPILSKGSEELGKYLKLAQERHELFSDKDLKTARDFGITQRELKGSVEALSIAFAKDLVPTLAKVLGGVTVVIDKANDLTSAVGGLSGVFKVVAFAATSGFSSALEKLGKSHADTQKRAAELDSQLKEERQTLEEGTKAAADNAKAIDDIQNAQVALIDTQFRYERAQRGLQKATEAVATATKDALTAIHDHGIASTEAHDADVKLKDAQLGVTESAVAQAKAAADLKVEQDAANGIIDDAATKNKLLKDELLKLAGTLAPNDPLRARILGFANEIKDATANRDISITIADEEARSQFNRLEHDIKQPISVPIEFSIRQIAEVSQAFLANHPEFVRRAEGGDVRKGQPVIVGEKRPELFIPDSNGRIIPSVPTGTNSGTPLSPTITINASFGPGTNADDFWREMENIAEGRVQAFAQKVTAGRLAGVGTR